MTTIAQRQQRRSEDQQLTEIAQKYRKETSRLGRAFVAYINHVGPLLDEAHRLHAPRRNGAWAEFCEIDLGCSKRHADRLRGAYHVMQTLEQAGAESLPQSESVCRELSRLEADQIADSWSAALATDDRPTAETIRQAVAKTKPDDPSKEKATSGEAALAAKLAAAVRQSKLSDAARRRILAKPLRELLEGVA